jgi:hypothetical protein
MYFGPRFFEIAVHTSAMITEAVFIAIPNVFAVGKFLFR